MSGNYKGSYYAVFMNVDRDSIGVQNGAWKKVEKEVYEELLDVLNTVVELNGQPHRILSRRPFVIHAAKFFIVIDCKPMKSDGIEQTPSTNDTGPQVSAGVLPRDTPRQQDVRDQER